MQTTEALHAGSHVLDEAERSLHDALCVLSQTVADSRVLYGGGYPEMQMAKVPPTLHGTSHHAHSSGINNCGTLYLPDESLRRPAFRRMQLGLYAPPPAKADPPLR